MRRLIALSLVPLLLVLGAVWVLMAQEVVPARIPQQAFAALLKAKQWRRDAILVIVEVNDYSGTGKFTIKFSFYSPSNQTGYWIVQNGSGSSISSEAGLVNWGTQAIPALFLDLPAAVQRALGQGMQGKMDHALLHITSSGLNWEIAPVFDPNLRTFTINATISSTSPRLVQPVSDWLIVPGQRIGPVSLGMTTVSALKALGQRSQKCTVLVLHLSDNGTPTSATLNEPVTIEDTPGRPTTPSNGIDPGFATSCIFERWGLFIGFEGDPGSSLSVRRATVVEAVAQDGDLSRKYLTDRGIRIGSSDQDIMKAYGDVQKKDGGSDDILMTYPQMGIEFTLGGYGANSEELPKNIVQKIAVNKSTP